MATTVNNYNTLIRLVWLYDTTTIDDTDTIDSAVMSVWGSAALIDELTSAMVLNLVSSAPASNTALANGDYATASFGTTKFVTGGFAHASWANGAYNAFTLNADGLTNISKTVVSKFGGRTDHDIDNVAPGGPFTSTNRDYTQGLFAEAVGTTTDPKLVIQHSVAFVPRLTIF